MRIIALLVVSAPVPLIVMFLTDSPKHSQIVSIHTSVNTGEIVTAVEQLSREDVEIVVEDNPIYYDGKNPLVYTAKAILNISLFFGFVIGFYHLVLKLLRKLV